MESFDGEEKKTGYDFSDFLEDEIKDASFKVSIFPHRVIPHVILILIPVIFYVFFHPFFEILDAVELDSYSTALELVLFLVFLLGIFITVFNCGKEVIVSGHGIVIRKFFFITESFSVHDVERCEVISGLVAYTKLGMEHYSKAVIYYDGGKSFYVTDNLYKGWRRLVQYMEMNGKVMRTGR